MLRNEYRVTGYVMAVDPGCRDGGELAEMQPPAAKGQMPHLGKWSISFVGCNRLSGSESCSTYGEVTLSKIYLQGKPPRRAE